jgi:type IV secretion system protein VirD4
LDGPERNKDLIADAQSIALQLCPEPAATGENTFFQKRIRKILVLGFVYLIVHFTAQVKRR